jgi:AraC family transcriptional regulator, transcriptional activator of pobA
MKNLFPFYTIGHFINEPHNNTDFELMRFESMEEPNVEDIHKHTFYEILWMEKGKSKQTIDYKEYEIAPNSLFFISPNQVHQFEEWRPLIGGSIMFTEDFFLLNQNNKDKLFELTFLDNFYGNPSIQLHKKEFSELLQTIHFLENEHKRTNSNKLIKQSLLHILMAQVQRIVESNSSVAISKKYIVVFKQFKELLEQHFEENKTASFFADKLSITTHHLNVVCKSITSKTASDVIRARVVLEAKRMLSFSDATINEIAAHLNIFDSSYFAKIFKAETNLSPMIFKNKISEKYRK